MIDAASKPEGGQVFKAPMYESYYPSTYFSSNPVVWKTHLLHWSIAYFIISIPAVGLFFLLPYGLTHPIKELAVSAVILVIGWGFMYLLMKDNRQKDLHDGSGTHLSMPRGGAADRMILELWSDCIIVRIGERHWVIKNNLKSIGRIDPHGKLWQVNLDNDTCFPLRTDFLTDLQSSQITNRVDLKAQIELNRDKIRKALESHIQGPVFATRPEK